MKKKVLIGMSGGVDSSVSALLLKNAGYDVAGATFKLWGDDDVEESGKCSSRDAEDARLVCEKLGIEHYVFDYRALFASNVISYFVDEYKNGRTPNPCIVCNRHIKFDQFLKKALEMGFDYIATGHYALIDYCEESGRYNLIKGEHDTKDQSYVLYTLTQEALAHTLFPIGELSKDEVRKIAMENDLVVANKPDSQDICFIPSGDYKDFLQKHSGKDLETGNFIDKDGKILGKHKGIYHYTIGQRKGLGLSFDKPKFVVDIDAQKNEVRLGDESELLYTEIYATRLNLINVAALPEKTLVEAKIRYAHKKAEATIYPYKNSGVKVVFATPQRAPTNGQSVVFYLGDCVYGGGVICNKEDILL